MGGSRSDLAWRLGQYWGWLAMERPAAAGKHRCRSQLNLRNPRPRPQTSQSLARVVRPRHHPCLSSGDNPYRGIRGAAGGYARRRRRVPTTRLAAPRPSKAMPPNSIGRLAPPPVNGSTPPPGRVDETPPSELVGADEEDPPTAEVVVSSFVVVVAPDVEVAPDVVVVAPEVEVAPEVLVAPEVVVGFRVVVVAPEVVVGLRVVVVLLEVVVGLVVVVVPEVLVEVLLEVLVEVLVVVLEVVGLGTQPVTQNTLYLTSAPWEPSAWMVSLTWKPCTGWGVMPVKSRV